MEYFKKGVAVILFLMTTMLACNFIHKSSDKYIRLNDTLIVKQKFYPSGKLEAEYSKNADTLTHGSVKLYNENGTLKLEYNSYYRKRQGLVKAYDANGRLEYIGVYHNGLKDSTWVWYYKDGKVESIKNWNNGLSEGLNKGYYPNGVLEYIGVYHNDVQDSIWTWYKDDGLIDHIETWKNGVCAH